MIDVTSDGRRSCFDTRVVPYHLSTSWISPVTRYQFQAVKSDSDASPEMTMYATCAAIEINIVFILSVFGSLTLLRVHFSEAEQSRTIAESCGM